MPSFVSLSPPGELLRGDVEHAVRDGRRVVVGRPGCDGGAARQRTTRPSATPPHANAAAVSAPRDTSAPRGDAPVDAVPARARRRHRAPPRPATAEGRADPRDETRRTSPRRVRSMRPNPRESSSRSSSTSRGYVLLRGTRAEPPGASPQRRRAPWRVTPATRQRGERRQPRPDFLSAIQFRGKCSDWSPHGSRRQCRARRRQTTRATPARTQMIRAWISFLRRARPPREHRGDSARETKRRGYVIHTLLIHECAHKVSSMLHTVVATR